MSAISTAPSRAANFIPSRRTWASARDVIAPHSPGRLAVRASYWLSHMPAPRSTRPSPPGPGVVQGGSARRFPIAVIAPSSIVPPNGSRFNRPDASPQNAPAGAVEGLDAAQGSGPALPP